MKNVIQKKLRIEKKIIIYEEIDIKEESCKQLPYKHNHYKPKIIHHHHIYTPAPPIGSMVVAKGSGQFVTHVVQLFGLDQI